MNITKYKSTSQYLSEILVSRKKTNPQYSLRAFAQHLKMSAGELSEILRGKRGVSLKGAVKVARALGLNPTEAKHLLLLTQTEIAGASGAKNWFDESQGEKRRQLNEDLFRIVSDWYCFAILNLAECSDFKWNSSWIGKRLGLSALEIDSALARLQRVGLIEIKNGKKSVVKDYVIAGDGVPSEAIRNYHRQMLKKAGDALELHPVEERDINGFGMAIDPSQLPRLKREIADFLDSLPAKYSKGNKTSVYHIELALFRLTERNPNEK